MRLTFVFAFWSTFLFERTSFKYTDHKRVLLRVQELCESRGGRPGLSVLMSLMVSVDVKQH